MQCSQCDMALVFSGAAQPEMLQWHTCVQIHRYADTQIHAHTSMRPHTHAYVRAYTYRTVL